MKFHILLSFRSQNEVISYPTSSTCWSAYPETRSFDNGFETQLDYRRRWILTIFLFKTNFLEQVANYFNKYGQVTYVHIPLDVNQGIHKGYGFVHFANKNSAIEAADDLSRPKLDDVSIYVKLAEDRKTQIKARHKTS